MILWLKKEYAHKHVCIYIYMCL